VQKAVDEVTSRAVALLEKVAPLPLEQTLAALKDVSQAAVKKSTAWVQLTLSKCPQCDSHHIAGGLQFIAANGKQGQATLPPLNKTKGFSGEEPVTAPESGSPAAPAGGT